MSDQLKDIYQRHSAVVPALGDAESAIMRARRRRLRRSIGGPVLAIGLVAGVSVVATNPPWDGRSVRPISTPTQSAEPTPTAAFEDWVPRQSRLGTQARTGTLIQWSCGSEACSAMLVRPDGTALDLSALRPDLAKRIAEHGIEGATLSWDARWLGLRIGLGYELHNLATGEVEQLAAGPPGSYWRVVGWDTGSFNVTIAQYQGDRVTAYVLFDLLRGGRHTYRPPAQPRYLPVKHDGNGVRVARPAREIPASGRLERTTKLPVDVLALESDGIEPQGSIARIGWPPPDLSGILREEETLAGDHGVPQQLCGPGLKWPDRDELCVAITFNDDSAARHPHAAILEADAYRRLDVRGLSSKDTWRPLAMLGKGLGIAVERGDQRTTELVELSQSGQRVLRQFPGGTKIILPGSTS